MVIKRMLIPLLAVFLVGCGASAASRDSSETSAESAVSTMADAIHNTEEEIAVEAYSEETEEEDTYAGIDFSTPDYVITSAAELAEVDTALQRRFITAGSIIQITGTYSHEDAMSFITVINEEEVSDGEEAATMSFFLDGDAGIEDGAAVTITGVVQLSGVESALFVPASQVS